MNYLLQPKWMRLALVTVVCLAVLAVPLVKRARATHEHQDRPISIRDLAGPWQATLLWSSSGCGPASGLINFTLDSTGTTPSAKLVGHSGCGDSTTTQTFTIHTLNPNGSGTAGLTCGGGCGWEFTIQVDRQRSMFNLVNVDPANFNNYVAGTAIRQ